MEIIKNTQFTMEDAIKRTQMLNSKMSRSSFGAFSNRSNNSSLQSKPAPYDRKLIL